MGKEFCFEFAFLSPIYRLDHNIMHPEIVKVNTIFPPEPKRRRIGVALEKATLSKNPS